MGYRIYLREISKESLSDLNKMSLSDIYDYIDDENNNLYDITKTVYYIKSDIDFSRFRGVSNFFKDEHIQNEYSSKTDCEIYIVNRDFLEDLISHYKSTINQYYKNLLSDIDDSFDKELSDVQISKMYLHIKDIANEWGYFFDRICPYNMDLNSTNLVDSYKFEYNIFDLVRIYKTFDWDNKVMFCLGG